MRRLLAVLLLTLPSLAGAQAVRPATRHGFAPDRLARIDAVLQAAVDSNRIAGAVALVLRDGQVVYERAVGWSDREAGRRMRADAIFRIASQTKALTTTAALMLVEEGRLSLDDPVSRFIPAYGRTTVQARSDSASEPVPARRQITVRHLLTHTAGISYGTESFVAARYAARSLGTAAGYGWYMADKNEPVCTTMETLASLPFAAHPGDAWVYGYSTDILGCVVERASGVPLDAFIRTRITDPLRMRDTHFYLPVAQRDRLAAVYASDTSGSYARAAAGARGQGDYVDGPRRSFSGGAGLLSTAGDYARFLQMLLNGGALDGVRILSPKMVDVMTSNQTGVLYSSAGRGFSLGFNTVERTGGDGLATAGSYGWGGAYGSNYSVDPAEGLVMVFMIQLLPDRSGVASRFSTLVYQALVEARKAR